MTTTESALFQQDADKPLIKVHDVETRSTGAPKQVRYVVLPPHHLMEWIHDTIPNAPIPKDALFRGLGLDARENWIGFEFTSLTCPEARAFYMTFEQMLRILREMLKAKLPADVELKAVFLSNIWTHMMLQLSGRFPEAQPYQGLPMIQVRYENKTLMIDDQAQPLRHESQRTTEMIT